MPEVYQAPRHGFRTFFIVWLTQSVSSFGSGITFFAVTYYLANTLYAAPNQRPELALALTAISLAVGVPIIFGAPLAGAWADRHDRKRTMIAMDFTNGLIDLSLILLLATHSLQFWMLMILLGVQAIAVAFHGASFDTSYAMLVPDEQLPRANGMMQMVFSLSGILSPALAALLISLPALAPVGSWLHTFRDGTPIAVGIDALTFFIAALVPLWLTIPSPQRADRDATGKIQASIWDDVRFGATYIWRRRPMLWLLGTFTVANFVGGVGILNTLMLKFNLAHDWLTHGFTLASALAALGMVGSLGGVLGGAAVSAWGGLKRSRIRGVLIPMIFASVAGIAFGLSPFFYLTLVIEFVSVAMIPFMNAHSQAIWQSQVPRAQQGRVFSIRRLIAQFTGPLSTLIFGLLGGFYNPAAIYVVVGVFWLLFVISQFFNRTLWRVEDREWIERGAVAHGEVLAEST